MSRPIPQAGRPVRVASGDGKSVDPDATQRALDALHKRIEVLEAIVRELQQ